MRSRAEGWIEANILIECNLRVISNSHHLSSVKLPNIFCLVSPMSALTRINIIWIAKTAQSSKRVSKAEIFWLKNLVKVTYCWTKLGRVWILSPQRQKLLVLTSFNKTEITCNTSKIGRTEIFKILNFNEMIFDLLVCR